MPCETTAAVNGESANREPRQLRPPHQIQHQRHIEQHRSQRQQAPEGRRVALQQRTRTIITERRIGLSQILGQRPEQLIKIAKEQKTIFEYTELNLIQSKVKVILSELNLDYEPEILWHKIYIK